MLIHCHGGLAQITLADDMVAIKDSSGLVSADLHSYSLGEYRLGPCSEQLSCAGRGIASQALRPPCKLTPKHPENLEPSYDCCE